jgi:hypothetical protein
VGAVLATRHVQQEHSQSEGRRGQGSAIIADGLVAAEHRRLSLYRSSEESDDFLDNEHDMLTTSRWSVGVVESIDGETIRVKGWGGSVSLDTVRVIVEEKQPKPTAPPDIF